jgi:type I restriction enzyme S subunit
VESSEYFVVRTSNVRDGNLILDDIKCTTKEGFIEWTQRAVPEHGDVLFTREAPAGESCLVPPSLNICMGQRMVLLRPKKDLVNPYFLSFYLNTREGKREIYQHVIGSTVTRINIDDILKIKIFCPSIAEQEKIASFLGAVDTRLTQLRRKRELLQTYKRGVMQKLFSQQLRFTQPDGSPFPAWKLRTLDELMEIKNGYAFSSDFFSVDTTDKILLTPGNFHVDGGLYFGSNTKYYQGEVEEKYILSNGDLLIVMTDLTKEMNILGNTIFLESDKIVLHNQRIGKILIKKDGLVTKQFLRDVLNSYACKKEIREKATGSTVRHTSNKTILSITLHIPLIKEQEKIASFLTAIDRKIEALSRQIEQTEQFKKGLLQKLFV